MGVLARNFENGSDGLNPVTRKYRVQSCLRRVVALTGATQMGRGYVLDVGTTRLEVLDRYVRWRDLTDPECSYEETCFYSTHKEMPKAEQCYRAADNEFLVWAEAGAHLPSWQNLYGRASPSVSSFPRFGAALTILCGRGAGEERKPTKVSLEGPRHCPVEPAGLVLYRALRKGHFFRFC